MLRNSDMMVYALQLKQKSTAGVFLRDFRTATSENNFGGLLLKRKQRERKMRNDPCGLKLLLSPGHTFIKSGMKQSSLSVFINLIKSLVVQFLPSRF